MACVLRWQVTITRLNHHFTGRKRQRGALGTGASIAPPCAHVLPSSPRIRALPCSTHACPSIARLARPALLRGCGAHAVCVCCAQARGALQAHVQGGGLGVWDAAREGWIGQSRCWVCVFAVEADANSQYSLMCRLCRVPRVWPISVWVHFSVFLKMRLSKSRNFAVFLLLYEQARYTRRAYLVFIQYNLLF